MSEVVKKEDILWQGIFWQFLEVPVNILKAWKNFLLFNLHYFSIPLLFKTFFSPWRRYQWFYPRGLSIGKYLEVFISNLISRILGAIMRTILILIGLLVEIFIILGGAICFLGWVLMPILLIFGIYHGFRILF